MFENYMCKKETSGIDDCLNTKAKAKVVSKVQVPKLYRVLLINDDYTPMDFVIHVLQSFFHKDRESAEFIMLKVHRQGIGECGVYSYEVAEMKVNQVMNHSRQNQYPLQCIMEQK
ncbi:ATP-dependent Clp protease adapter ClpS [Candidatus Liberibacter brunswickensis]